MTIPDGKRAMSSIDLTSTTRTAIGAMIDREEARVGSREVAYERVAKAINASHSWVKKFSRNDPDAAEPRMSLFLRIRIAYEDFCARVEQEHFNELIKIQNLRRELDAPIEGFDRLVAGQAGAAPARAPENVEEIKSLNPTP